MGTLHWRESNENKLSLRVAGWLLVWGNHLLNLYAVAYEVQVKSDGGVQLWAPSRPHHPELMAGYCVFPQKVSDLPI